MRRVGIRAREASTCVSAWATSSVRGQAGLELRPGKVQGVLLRGDVALDDGKLLLLAAENHVVESDLGEERDEGVAPRLDLGLERVPGGFYGAARAAEDIHFPGGVELADERVVGAGIRKAGRKSGQVRRQAGMDVGGVRVECRIEGGAVALELRAGLADTRLSQAHVQVRLHGLADQAAEGRIVERLPPALDVGRRCVLRGGGEGGRDVFLRRLIVRADLTAGRRSQRDGRGDDERAGLRQFGSLSFAPPRPFDPPSAGGEGGAPAGWGAAPPATGIWIKRLERKKLVRLSTFSWKSSR